MVGLVIVGHGSLAQALLATAGMICGEAKRVQAVEFEAHESSDILREKIAAAIGQVDGHDGEALLLCDLAGGTPANVCAEFVLERGCHAICGVNVPMLVEVLLGRENEDLAGVARTAFDAGREGLVDLNERLVGRDS